MTEARVGRLVPACLHQAIADRLPQRLEFYESWLHPDGLRDGTIGLGPITAVIGFLRTEGQGYDDVVMLAGTLAAEWTVASISPVRRRWIGWLPRRWRARAALRVAAGIVQLVDSASRASVKVRHQQAEMAVESSLFCAVRERRATPLCGFYLAAAIESLRQFGVPSSGQVASCRAAGAPACRLRLDLFPAAAAPPAVAA